MISTYINKQNIWNDPDKLMETIKTVAVHRVNAEKQKKKYREQILEARKLLEDAETNIRIWESEMNEAESLGIELTRRLMKLEETK
jgi:ribonuclease HI